MSGLNSITLLLIGQSLESNSTNAPRIVTMSPMQPKLRKNPRTGILLTKKTVHPSKKAIESLSSTWTPTSNSTEQIMIMSKSMTPPMEKPNPGTVSFHHSITITKTFSPRKISTNSLNDDLGIMQSSSHQDRNLPIVKPIPCRRKNKNHFRSL